MTLPRRLAALGAMALLAMPRQAQAHAILLSATPADGATVPAGPVVLALRFNSRIDHARSSLSVLAADGTTQRLPILPDSPPDMIQAATNLRPGTQRIRWQVLAIDGHITRGEFHLSVQDK